MAYMAAVKKSLWICSRCKFAFSWYTNGSAEEYKAHDVHFVFRERTGRLQLYHEALKSLWEW